MSENINNPIQNIEQPWNGHSFNEVEDFIKGELSNKYDKVCEGQNVSGRVVLIGENNTLVTTQTKLSDLRTNSEQSDWDEQDATDPKYIQNKPKINTDISFSLTPNSEETISGTVKFHKISKTGSYTDLNDKPNIPNSANNGVLTIKENNVSLGTFSADQLANTTINIQTPTKTSDLDNDSGYVTLSQIPAQVNSDWTSEYGVARILNKPTKVSDFANDSNFVSKEYVDTQDNAKQDTLVSGITIKTINNIDILGSGDIVIPKGDDAVNPFKGWYDSSSDLPTPSFKGDYAYVSYTTEDNPPQTGVHIWIWNESLSTWEDTGREVDTSDVHTFETGEEVNEVSIVNDTVTGGEHDVLSAEQGKILGETVFDSYSYEDTVFTEMDRVYIDENGKWHTSGTSRTSGAILDVLPGEIYQINKDTEHSDATQYIALLKSADNIASGASVKFTSEPPFDEGRYLLTEDVMTVTMPEDCYVLYKSLVTTTVPLFNIVIKKANVTEGLVKRVEKLEETTENYGDLSDDVEKLHADVYGEKILLSSSQMSLPEETGGCMDREGWSYSSYKKHVTFSYSAEESGYNFLYVEPQPDKHAWVTFFKRSPEDLLESRDINYLITNGYINDDSTVIITEPGEVQIPSYAQYIVFSRVTYTSSGYLKKYPQLVESRNYYVGIGLDKEDLNEQDTFYGSDATLSVVANSSANHLISLQHEVDSEGYEVAKTLQQVICQKKAKQWANIQWTPKGVIYKTNNETYSIGVPFTGLPYSSVKECDKYINKDVSIETFMTAVNNPFSLLYTESVGSGSHSRSSWGVTYHGDNCNEYYGMVCSEYSSLMSGFNVDYSTSLQAWLAKYYHKLSKLALQAPESVEIGDVYWRPGHCMVIVGIKRDSQDNVTKFVVGESTTSKTRIFEENVGTFIDNLANHHHIVYRSLDLYKNFKYTPSPFVRVDDEPVIEYVYNNDICTYAGDKASFRASTFTSNVANNDGDLVVLNYNLDNSKSDWYEIELYKYDDITENYLLYQIYKLNEIVQSELPESQRNHALIIGRGLGYGLYKARISDMNGNYSDYTSFEMIDTNVEYTVDGDYISVDFSSNNSSPVAFKMAILNGSEVVMRELLQDEIKKGHLFTNVVRLNKEAIQAYMEEMPSGSSLTVNDISTVSELSVKIYFQGQYGRVTNKVELVTNPWKK